ncbi:MAG: hypothetical protein NTY77_10400 [Elusimicrobia bacterium]|nr:hypothetical protein [Elusimicrobiota bacterium]
MGQLLALQQAEIRLSAVSVRVVVLSRMLEDLLFRAQRMSRALKDDAGADAADSTFGRDLQALRGDVHVFGRDSAGLSAALAGIEPPAGRGEPSSARVQAVRRLTHRLHRSLAALLDQAVLAHRHLLEAEHKVEAWGLVEELGAVSQQAQVLAGIANRLLAAAGGGTCSPEPTLRLRAAVPLRPMGRLIVSPPSPQQA